MRPKVYVTRPIFREAVELLETLAQVTVWPQETPPPYDALREEVRDSDGLFSLLTDTIDPALMDAAPRLRVVSNMAVGYDNIDVPAATVRGVYVGNTPGVLTETTADFTFALMAAWARRIPEAQTFTRQGLWKTWGPMLLLGAELHGATLALVGLGRVGQAVAKRASGFGMRVLYHSRSRNAGAERELGVEYVPDLHMVLAQADFVSLHVPLTDQTRGLIGVAEFEAMQPHAALINTARGEVVDQKALYRALKDGLIGGAALDVADPEPMVADDPLLGLDNVIVTPHIGSASHVTRMKMAMLAAQNIVDVLEGRAPTHCVNPDARL